MVRLVLGPVALEQQREAALLPRRQRPPERGPARAAVEEPEVELAAPVDAVGAPARGEPARGVMPSGELQRRAAQGHHRRLGQGQRPEAQRALPDVERGALRRHVDSRLADL